MSFWDHLAPCWHLMEDSGLVGNMLAPHLDLLAPPILVVGAGQGVLVAWLRGRGKPTFGVDSSPAMVAAARARRGLQLTLADGGQLPFPDHAFGSLVLATGVLDGGDGDPPILTECARVSKPGAHRVSALFTPSRARLAPARRVGLCDAQHYLRPRMVQVWLHPPERWPALVQGWTGRTDWSHRDHAVLDEVRQDITAYATCLRRHGRAPREALAEAFAAPQRYFRPDEVTALATGREDQLVTASVYGDVTVLVTRSPTTAAPTEAP